MRLRGQVQECVMVILIDTESTHNFIDSSIAKKNQLLVQLTKRLAVQITNGAALTSEGKCLDVQFHMQGNSYSTDFFSAYFKRV